MMEDIDALETEPLFAQREAMDVETPSSTTKTGGKMAHPKHKKKNEHVFKPASARELKVRSLFLSYYLYAAGGSCCMI